MDSPARYRYGMAFTLAIALTIALTGSADAASHAPAPTASPAAFTAASLLGKPGVPVSVTRARPFAVTGTVSPGYAGQVSLVCYRLVSGHWTPTGSFPASVTTAAADARYAGTVSLDAAGTWVVRAESTATPGASVSATSSAIRVSNRADGIVWNRDGVLTLPEKMRYRSDARQLIVVTAKSLKSHSGTMAVYEYRSGDWVKLFSYPCRLGRNGLIAGEKRRQGNGKTPTGIWQMPGYAFGQHASRPKGTKLAYKHITKYNWWSAEKGSRYNTWITTRRRWVNGEHLINYTTTYEYALSSGYNSKPNPSVYGRGTAIFLHVRLAKTTAGCISVSRTAMKRVFKTMDPKKRRVFVIGTLGKNDPTRVDLY